MQVFARRFSPPRGFSNKKGHRRMISFRFIHSVPCPFFNSERPVSSVQKCGSIYEACRFPIPCRKLFPRGAEGFSGQESAPRSDDPKTMQSRRRLSLCLLRNVNRANATGCVSDHFIHHLPQTPACRRSTATVLIPHRSRSP